MNCPKCGTPIVEGEKFCRGCGNQIINNNINLNESMNQQQLVNNNIQNNYKNTKILSNNKIVFKTLLGYYSIYLAMSLLIGIIMIILTSIIVLLIMKITTDQAILKIIVFIMNCFVPPLISFLSSLYFIKSRTSKKIRNSINKNNVAEINKKIIIWMIIIGVLYMLIGGNITIIGLGLSLTVKLLYLTKKYKEIANEKGV